LPLGAENAAVKNAREHQMMRQSTVESENPTGLKAKCKTDSTLISMNVTMLTIKTYMPTKTYENAPAEQRNES